MTGPEGDGVVGERAAVVERTAAPDEGTGVGAGSDAGVRLEFVATTDDLAEAVRLALRGRGNKFRKLVYRPAASVFCLLLGAFLVVDRISGGGAPVGLSVATLLLGAMPFIVPRLSARASVATLAKQGTVRILVDAGGLRTQNDVTNQATNWAAYGGWLEGPRTFTLTGPGRASMCVAVLPKSGITEPGGADRLRALLAAHLPRR